MANLFALADGIALQIQSIAARKLETYAEWEAPIALEKLFICAQAGEAPQVVKACAEAILARWPEDMAIKRYAAIILEKELS